jgi:hypothetical protein
MSTRQGELNKVKREGGLRKIMIKEREKQLECGFLDPNEGNFKKRLRHEKIINLKL